jgi:carbon-monoxide dehydrogenase large subunit
MTGHGIGSAVPRREDDRFLRGAGTYVTNLSPEGALEAVFVRSTVAHGLLRGIDLSAVRSAAGVVAAYAAADLDLPDLDAPRAPVAVEEAMRRPLLARARVRFAGEPVAVILADSAYAAADAVELADVDIEPLPVVADPPAALHDGALLFPGAATNVAARAASCAGEDRAGAYDVEVELEVEHPRVAAVPLEPLGIVARPEAAGGVTVWVGHQGPWSLRSALARLLELDEALVRVVVPDVGGGFGAKAALYPEYAVVAACALRLGRPVRWVATRSENMVIGMHGRGQRHRIRLSGDPDGRVRAVCLDVVGDLGAYPQTGSVIPSISAAMATGPYDIERVETSVTAVVTNRAPTGAYRGAGRPEAALTIERAIEAFAHAAGLEPTAVRRRNFVPSGAMPYDAPGGARYDSGDYAAALDLALERVDLPALRAEQAARLAQGSDRLLGVAVTAFVERAGGPPGAMEYGSVEIGASGEFVVRSGAVPIGQGHETTWSQIVADVFALDDFDAVRVVTGDTAEVPEGTGSFGSRSAQVGGSALLRCSRLLRRRVADLAASELECSASDVVVAGGVAHVRGDPGSSVPIADLARSAGGDGALRVEECYTPGAQTFPYGVYAAVVEVDRETGHVTVLDLLAVDDCGTVLNPVIVEGQVHGSAVQGLGQALYEEFTYGDDGQPLSSTLLDYTIPGAPDVPAIRTGRLSTPSPVNPLGAKGTGEAGCIGAPPALVCAVLDALRPLGVTTLDMPMTPQRVWRAIRASMVGNAAR